jgi:hypothetical protein
LELSLARSPRAAELKIENPRTTSVRETNKNNLSDFALLLVAIIKGIISSKRRRSHQQVQNATI